MEKRLITSIIAVVAVLIIGTIIYSAMAKPAGYVNNSNNIENSAVPSASPNPSTNISVEVKTDGNNSGGLLICADQCGDGICQEKDLSCKEGNLNCICPETKDDCPKDCK